MGSAFRERPLQTEAGLLFGWDGLFFRGPFFDNAIVFHRALGAGANLSASWICSHSGPSMGVGGADGKESLDSPAWQLNLIRPASVSDISCA
jgi:hypothetical protein